MLNAMLARKRLCPILINVTDITHQADRICSVDNKKNVAFQPKGKVETIGTKCHLVD